MRQAIVSVLAAALLGLAACGAEETASSAPGKAAPAALRLYVLDCGTMKTDPARFRMEPSEIATTDMSTPCFLIAHPKGTLMWNAGCLPDSDWTPTGAPVAHHLVLPNGGGERDLTLRKPLLAQLSELGYAPSDITYFALSHYHWDHTANANAFKDATWIVRKIERDAMFADTPPGVTTPATYGALKDAKTIALDAEDHDVFGDGSVVIKFAPGHTPGHQVLYLKLAKTGDVVLSGDLYHYPEMRTLKRVATFDFDQNETPVSREKIEAFLASTGAQLWIEHDAMGNAKLKKAPEYYE